MIVPNSISTKALFSTARLVATYEDGRTSIGTSFFFNFKLDESRNIPVLITNRHVISGTKKGSFFLHLAETDGKGGVVPSDKWASVELGDFENSWIPHPAGIDICAMPVAYLLDAAQKAGKNIYHVTFGEEVLPNDQALGGLMAMEEATMVGYPIGLWDSKNKLPLLRRGITASHPGIDFEGEPVGLLDIATYPGSSGSPVMLLNEGSFATPMGLTVGSRILLLGILYQYYHLDSSGVPEATNIPSVDITKAPVGPAVHMGKYIKARELLELKKVFVKLA
jgi:hypothetical protein